MGLLPRSGFTDGIIIGAGELWDVGVQAPHPGAVSSLPGPDLLARGASPFQSAS